MNMLLAVAFWTSAVASWIEPIASQQVQLHGELGNRVEQVVQRHQSPPLDDVDFLLADVGFQYRRRFTDYSGDISGRYLGAMATLSDLLDLQVEPMRQLAARLPDYQKQDGHFGAEQNLAESITQDRDMTLLWGNGRLLMGMVEYCKAYGDNRLLEAAKKLGDYYVKTDPYYNRPENFAKVGGSFASGFATCYLSAIDGLVGLAEITRSKGYLNQAERIAALLEQAPDFEGFHSHGRLTAFRGLLDLDRTAGKSRYRRPVMNAHEKIVEQYLFPTDGLGEIFDRTYNRDEGCSEADWIRLNIALWRATGSTAYLDMAESTVWNHLLAAQFSNGGFGHGHMRRTEDAVVGFEAEGAEAYWCCSEHGARALADYARNIVTSDGSSIYVNFLEPSTSSITVGDAPMTVTIEEQGPSTYLVRVTNQRRTTFPINVRVPRWATNLELVGEQTSRIGGYLRVEKEWEQDKPLRITAPERVWIRDRERKPLKISAGSLGKSVQIYYGRYLLALPDWYAGRRVERATAHLPVSNGEVLFSRVNDPVGGFPVVVEVDGAVRRARLVPMYARPRCGCLFVFDTVLETPEEFDRIGREAADFVAAELPLFEFHIACDGQCELFLNRRSVVRHSGWHESTYVSERGKWARNTVGVRASGRAFMATVRVGDTLHTTRPQQWACRRTTQADKTSIEWEDTINESGGNWQPVTDLGEWGVAPWYRYSGGFAGTGAHWIWCKDAEQEEPVLLRYTLDVPPEEN